jgi:hypothetical protein
MGSPESWAATMKNREEKEGVVAPCALDTTTQNHVLCKRILAGQNSLSRKKGARGFGKEKEEKHTQGTPQATESSIIPAEPPLSKPKNLVEQMACTLAKLSYPLPGDLRLYLELRLDRLLRRFLDEKNRGCCHE